LNEREFQFEWDEIKAAANLRKHGVSFELASTVFGDPRLFTVPDLEHGEAEERWFSLGCASNSAALDRIRLDRVGIRLREDPTYLSPRGHPNRDAPVRGGSMSEQPIDEGKMPEEIDFSKGVRGQHHIPAGAKVFLPVSIERSVWEYFSVKAEQKGTNLSDLLTDVLRRDIEIHESLK
jgi:uncharacterized DUF497 family protein